MLQSKIIKSRGKSLVSIVESPDQEDKNIAVFFCHGFVGHKITPFRMIPKLSAELNTIGISTIRTDCVGSGDGEGDAQCMVIPGQIEDYVTVYREWMKEYNWSKVILMGYSMGGTTSSLLLDELHPIGLMLWSPVANPFWVFHHILGNDAFTDGVNGEDTWIEGDYVHRNFFKGLDKIDPLIKTRSFNGPVRICHGQDDQDVLPINAKLFQLNSKDCKVHYVPNAGHTYESINAQEELISTTIEFIKEIVEERK